MKTLVYSLAISALALTSAQAAVLTYGTFAGASPADSAESIGGTLGSTAFGGYGAQGMLGVSFTVSGTGYSLSSVKFDLSNNTSGGTRLAILRVYSGGMGTLNGGTLLASATSGALSTTATLTTFNVNVALSSGTTYWLAIEGSNTAGQTGSIRIHSATGNETITDSAAIDIASGFRHSALDDGGGTNFSDTSGQMPNFQVTVPEPHEYAMVAGLGLCAFAAYRKRAARVAA